MPVQLLPNPIQISVDKHESGIGTVDFGITPENISEYSVTDRSGADPGEGTIVIDNENYQYTWSDTELNVGDKLTVYSRYEPGGVYGTGVWGTGKYGGMGYEGTYRIVSENIIDYTPPESDYTASLQDWVFGTLDRKHVWYIGTDKPISGSEDAILNTILRENCPEISRALLPDIPQTTDYYTSGGKARDVVTDLADIAADYLGPLLVGSDHDALVFQPVEEMEHRYESALPDDAFAPLKTSQSDHNLVNWIRVSGGIDDTGNLDDSQPVVDDFVEVNQNNRVITRVAPRKAEVSSMEIYTRGKNLNADGVRIRLQDDIGDGSGPIDPDNPDSDHITGQVRKVALDDDGWTTWRLGENTIPDDPWLIIDSPGETGQEIGVNSAGVPAYKMYFPKPIETVLQNINSQEKYGRVDGYIDRDSLQSENAARYLARATLDRQGVPSRTIGPLEATSQESAALHVGDTVPFDRRGLRATGDFIVTSRSQTMTDVTLKTELEFASVSGSGLF